MKPIEVSVQDFRASMASYLRRAAFGKERIVVTFHGKPACVLGPLDLIEGPADAKPVQKRVASRAKPAR